MEPGLSLETGLLTSNHEHFAPRDLQTPAFEGLDGKTFTIRQPQELSLHISEVLRSDALTLSANSSYTIRRALLIGLRVAGHSTRLTQSPGAVKCKIAFLGMAKLSDSGSMTFSGHLDGRAHHPQGPSTCTQKDLRYDTTTIPDLYCPFAFGQAAAHYDQAGLINQAPFSPNDAAGPADSILPQLHLELTSMSLDEQQEPRGFELDRSTPACLWEAPVNGARQADSVPGGVYQDFPCNSEPLKHQQTNFESPALCPALSQVSTPPQPLGNTAAIVQDGNFRTIQQVSNNNAHRCNKCPKSFQSPKQLHRHVRDTHGPKTRHCDYPGCPKSRRDHGFTRADILKRHMNRCPFRPEKLRRGKHVPSLPESSVTIPVAEAEDDEGKRGRNTHSGRISSSDDFISEQLQKGTLQDLADLLKKVSRRVNDLAGPPAKH